MLWMLLEGADGLAGSGNGGAGGGAGPEGDAGGSGTGTEGAEGAGAQPSPSLTMEQVTAAVNEAVGPLKTQLSETKGENRVLQAALLEARRQPAQVQQAVPKKEWSPPAKDAFIAEMNADPGAAVAKLVREIVEPLVEERVRGASTETQSAIEKRERVLAAFEGDRQTTVNLYGEYVDHAEHGPEFQSVANGEFAKIVQQRGQAMPGDFELAASRALRILQKGGKFLNGIAATQAKLQNENNGRVVNIFKPTNPVTSSAGGPGAKIGIKTIDDLEQLSAEEKSQAKSNCRKWGLSEEAFVRNYVEAAKENPYYGTGR